MQVPLIPLRNSPGHLDLVLLRAVAFLGPWTPYCPCLCKKGETLKTYSDMYWEMYNEIEGNFKDFAISTFKSGLLAKHGLKKSLIGKPITSLCQLIDRIDKYKKVEKDQQLVKGKVKVIPQEKRDFRSDQYNNNRPWRDYVGQSRSTNTQAIKRYSENRCIRF